MIRSKSEIVVPKKKNFKKPSLSLNKGWNPAMRSRVSIPTINVG
jgi:hypothetical protein